MSNSDSERHIDEEGPDDGAVIMGRHNHTREDTRLLKRAIREQWPIPEEFRKPIVDRQIKIAIDPKSTNREATSSARCLTAMVGQNLTAAMKELDKQLPDQHEVHISQAESRLAILNDPEYLEFREQKRLAAVSEILPPIQANGSTNGHHNGNGSANGNGHHE